MPELLSTSNPAATHRAHLNALIARRAELQDELDDVAAAAGDSDEQLAALAEVDADIARAQALVEAAERGAKAVRQREDAARLAKQQAAAEKAYERYMEAALRLEATLERAVEQHVQVYAAYAEFERLTPDRDAIVAGSATRAPAVLTRIMARFQQALTRSRIKDPQGRPMSSETTIEPLSAVFGARRASALRWLGL